MSKKDLEREAEELDEEIHRLEQKRLGIAKKIMGEEATEVKELLTERLQLVRELPENPIPSILTVSLREIINYYREKIVRLQAEGGEYPSSSETLDEEYGVTFNPGSRGTIRVDYTQKRAADGTITNPINEEWISKMHGYLDDYLQEYEGHPPNIPVTLLKVEIEDDRIAELSSSSINTFDATFESDPPEPQMKDRIHNPESDYYDLELAEHWRVLLGQGFRMRNLNLKLFRNTGQIFIEGRNVWNPIIQWRGWPSNDPPRSHYEIAGIIWNKYLPPKPFKLLKFYRIMRGNKLMLDGFR